MVSDDTRSISNGCVDICKIIMELLTNKKYKIWNERLALKILGKKATKLLKDILTHTLSQPPTLKE